VKRIEVAQRWSIGDRRRGLFYYRPGRPALIAILVVSLAVAETQFLLIRHGPIEGHLAWLAQLEETVSAGTRNGTQVTANSVNGQTAPRTVPNPD
jgi:hypothetical protein